MKQVYNPYLPLNEYIPDGEPHVFGDRVYIYGSHDREGGETFCELDYVVYSADVEDLTDWKCEGTIYRASQDPHCHEIVKDAGKRKYLKRLHSGGRETPSDIPDEQYLRHTNLLRNSCLRDHSDLSRVYILSKRCNDGS